MASGAGATGEPPEVSVVVVTSGPHEPVRPVLASLAAQSLPPQRFEIVLVSTGPGVEVAGTAAEFRAAHPDHLLRLGRTSGGSSAAARTIGLGMARGTHTLFVADGRPLEPGLLAALSAQARHRVVPVAAPARDRDVVADPADLLLGALERDGGKLVETRVARTQGFEDSLGRGSEFAYWLALVEHEGVEFLLVEPGSGTPPPAPPRGDFSTEVVERLVLIHHLQQQDLRSDRARELAEQMVVLQAEQVREFLLAHPDRHGDVVDHVRELGIEEMPWSVVNRGRARHLALLYLFTPFLDTSALVAARRLRERGWVTDVVSQDVSNLRTRDDASSQVAAEVVDQTRVLPGDLDVGDWASVATFAEHALAAVGELESAKGPYETVYSRAMAVHSHFAAALLKLRSPRIRWVAEFSDPLTFNARGEVRVGELAQDWVIREIAEGLRRAGHDVPTSASFYEWGELIAYALADEIVFTNRHQLDFMLGYCADRALAARAATISRSSHHPVPSPDLYRAARASYALDPDKLHIGYFGNFYVNRGLSEITGALNALSLAERDRIQLHVFTANPEALVLQTLEHGLADVIRVNPMLGFLTYLNLTTRFDVLLITDFTTLPHFDPNPYLPAKLADYLGSGSKIWAVHEPGSVLSTVEVDYDSLLGDVVSATRVLRALAATDRSLAQRR